MDEPKKPILRFKGFTEAWEQRQLSDYLETSTEKNLDNYYTKQDVLSVSGDVGIVNQIEFQGRSFAGASVANYGVVHTGDVVYTKSPLSSNPFGIIKTNKGKAGIVSTLYAVYHTRENIYPNFVQNYFEQNARLNNYLQPLVNKGAKNDMKVSDDSALKGEVVFPSYEEQKVISDYFSVLDKLISLHQRKYDKIINVKKAMLEKMFPKNSSNTPEIRLKGFTDPWEPHKFNEVFAERRDKTEIENEDTLLSCAINGMFLNSELFGHFRGSSTIGYLKVKKNDLILSAQNLHLGNANVNLRFEHGIISPAYKVYELIDSEPNFIQAWVKKDETKNFFLAATTEGASQCRKNIEWETLYNQTMFVPAYKEQEAIGTFFKSLDNLITLHQRRLEKLRNIKLSCMEKMFV